MRREHIFPFGFGSLLGLLLRRDYLVGSHGLRRLLELHLSYRHLERAALPILISGDEVILSNGPAVDAVLASSAIPGVFPSVSINGRELVDGGVTNNTPISAAIRLGAEQILVLPTGFACALRRIPTTVIGKALHSLNLLVARQLVNDVERFRTQVALQGVPPLCSLDVSPYDYGGGAALIERAARTTRKWIAGGGLAAGALTVHGLEEHQH